VRAAGTERCARWRARTTGDARCPRSSRGARRRALAEIDSRLRSALERAARNIGRFHSAAPPDDGGSGTEPGVVVGRRPDPLQRVGIYSPAVAPLTRAVYSWRQFRRALLAFRNHSMLTPQSDGFPAAVVLAACEIAGVNRVFAVGGAGAIAAMAYGTESVPRVDRIVGPGNAYVAEAKLQVNRDVGSTLPRDPASCW